MLMVKENMELSYLRVDPIQIVSPTPVVVSAVDVLKARALYLDIADAIWQTQSMMCSMLTECPFSDHQLTTHVKTKSEFFNESCIIPCKENSPAASMTALTVHSIREKWMSILARRVCLRFLMYRLILHCSTSSRPPDAHLLADEISVLQTIDSHSRALGDAESIFLQREDAIGGNVAVSSPGDNIAKVKELVSKMEESVADAILFGWSIVAQGPNSAITDNSRSESGIDPIVLWVDRQPPVVHLLNSIVVGYYNRIVSVIGGQVDQKNFEYLEGNQAKLDLITFVATNDDMLVEYVKVILNSMGIEVDPPPKLSLALDIDGLLSRFSAVIISEISVYISRIFASDHGNSECSLLRDADGAMEFVSPWEVEVVGGQCIIGPVPQLVHAVGLTFLQLAKPPHAGIPLESRSKVYAMNSIVAHSVMKSYSTLVWKYGELLAAMHEELDQLLEGGEGVVVGDSLDKMMNFVCSIANDSARLSSDFLPEVFSESRFYLGCGEDEREETDLDLARDYLSSLATLDAEISNELMFVGWTAIEQLVKVIFMDMQEEFIVNFDDIWTAKGSATTIRTILRTLTDYLSDFSISLTSQNYLMLVLSCGHKLVQR
jgi:hypothetical protein